MLVVGPLNEGRRSRCVQHWLQLRESWYWLLNGDRIGQLNLSPPRSADWRHYLNVGLDGLRMSAGSNKKRTGLLAYFDTALVGNEISPSLQEARWFGQPIDLDDSMQMTQIAWELYEIAFRVELAAIDHIVVPGPSDCSAMEAMQYSSERAKMIANVFGERHFMISTLPAGNEGLASYSLSGRAPCLEALRRVLARWPDAPSAIRTSSLSASTLVHDIRNMEQTLATFYVQTFWERAGRAAAVPHRLPGVF